MRIKAKAWGVIGEQKTKEKEFIFFFWSSFIIKNPNCKP